MSIKKGLFKNWKIFGKLEETFPSLATIFENMRVRKESKKLILPLLKMPVRPAGAPRRIPPLHRGTPPPMRPQQPPRMNPPNVSNVDTLGQKVRPPPGMPASSPTSQGNIIGEVTRELLKKTRVF